MSRKRVAILISGRGSNMAALIEAARQPDYPAEIVLVVSNRPDAGGLTTARAAGIETAVVDHTIYGKDRAAFESDLQRTLAQHGIAIVCLAGFMRILTAEFVTQWQGLDTHARALEAGVKIHGATVHFVVPEMDSGPIIAQGAVAVHENDREANLAARVLMVEHRLYPMALKLVAEGRIELTATGCRIAGAHVPDGVLVVPDERT
jgi:phosphoribosylglycinamide formyltransferase-1